MGAVVVTGARLRELRTTEEWDLLLQHGELVFARTSPQQKLQIVEHLQRRGEVVAVTGERVVGGIGVSWGVGAWGRGHLGSGCGCMGNGCLGACAARVQTRGPAWQVQGHSVRGSRLQRLWVCFKGVIISICTSGWAHMWLPCHANFE